MENQVNVGDQNIQQIGKNPVSQNSQVSGKQRFNYWKLTSFILFFLFIVALISRVNIFEELEKTDLEKNKTSNIIDNPTLVVEYIPQPTVPTTLVTPKKGKSYGIFYPFSEGITINNDSPTIIGKITQSNELYLDTNFGIEESPVSGENEYFLRFVPGRIKNLKIKIDSVEVKNVFGIPQYPTVLCKKINLNLADDSVSYDTKTGVKSPPDDTFNSESDCITNKKSELPPLVFFAKVETPLLDGKHTLTLEGKTTFQSMTFFVDKNYHLSSQNIFVVDKSSPYYRLIHSDTCSPGYYYDSNYLKIPLPSFNNSNLFYGISFPQSKDEVGSINRRRVQISFEGNRFDLFFPQSSTYYEGKSSVDKNNLLSPYHELFLPIDHLVFTDGTKASYVDAYKIIPADGNYAHGYFEIFPIDVSGGEYRDSFIPWVISGSSGCDG